MPTLKTSALQTMAFDILVSHGTPQDIARDVAAHLTLAERSGHASHGLSILPSYLQAIADGLLEPSHSALCVHDEGSFLTFDGQRGFGQHVGAVAVEAAIARTREIGNCFLSVRNSYHLGRAGHYGEQVAKAGFVYLSFINVVGRPPMVAPFGGKEARLSTNPICFSGPMPDGRAPFLLDYATSGIAANKARLTAAKGEQLAEGLMIDSSGAPTTDPAALSAHPPGALLPFGAHKGYALGLAAELLAGIFSGGGTLAPEHSRDGGLRNNLFAILMDPARFGATDWQCQETAAFADYVAGCPPAPGTAQVMFPGEIEAKGQQGSAETLEMSDAAWGLFAASAKQAGLAPELCLV